MLIDKSGLIILNPTLVVVMKIIKLPNKVQVTHEELNDCTKEENLIASSTV